MDWPTIFFVAFILWAGIILGVAVVTLFILEPKIVGMTLGSLILCVGVAIPIVQKLQDGYT